MRRTVAIGRGSSAFVITLDEIAAALVSLSGEQTEYVNKEIARIQEVQYIEGRLRDLEVLDGDSIVGLLREIGFAVLTDEDLPDFPHALTEDDDTPHGWDRV